MSDEGLPRTVAVAWGVAEFPQRGPKRELSHERIVEAAIELADAEGLEAVTMQRVAASFGFTTMALYRYISGKGELQRLMLDASLNGMEIRALPTDDWRVGLEAWARLLAAAYRKHPWVLELPVDRDLLIMPNNMTFVDAGLRALRTLPLPLEQQMAIIVTCSVLVRGFSGVGGGLDASAEYSPETIAAIKEVVTTARFPHLAPILSAYLGEEDPLDGERDSVGEDFELALGFFLDGVAAQVQAGGTVSAPVEPEPPSSPQEAYEHAERAWQEAVASRKAAEQQVKELYARESEAQKARDDAKELMKAAQKYERRRANG